MTGANVKHLAREGINAEDLSAILAARVMGWSVCPDRFLTGERRWLPRWRFRPTTNISDAFQLLKGTDVAGYVLLADRNGVSVKLRTSAASAEASGPSLPLAICLAIARLYGIRVEEHE